MKSFTVCFFLRKSNLHDHFSLEKYYLELIRNHHYNKFIFKLKICPLVSKGFFRRLYLIFWAYFNQGDINHICGDINFLSIILKNNTILTIHDNYSMIRLGGFKKIIYYIFWLKLPLYRCKKIITVSEKTKFEILSYFPEFKKKIIVIEDCIQSIFKKKLKKYNSKYKKVLIIGTSINKNFYNVILALSKINCIVLIVGFLDEQKKFFLKKLKIRYENYFNLTDLEVYKIYCKSDFLLYASLYEGFGLPILEAQAIGRPVITSNFEPFLNTGGDAAFYVNPNSVQSIKFAVQKIISSSKLRKKLVCKGFENVKRFDVKQILRKHYDCYNELLNN